MDPTKKAGLEKRLVVGLAAIFIVILLTGPLKHTRILGMRLPFMTASAGKEKASMAPLPTEPTPQASMKKATPQVDVEMPPRPVATPTQSAGYAAGDVRDPMKSLLPATPPPPTPKVEVRQPTPTPRSLPTGLRLQGVVWGGDKPRAIISNGVYGVGDDIDGATIRSIERERVVFDVAGTPMVLNMKKKLAASAEADERAAQ